jgi:hypothetical protein
MIKANKLKNWNREKIGHLIGWNYIMETFRRFKIFWIEMIDNENSRNQKLRLKLRTI